MSQIPTDASRSIDREPTNRLVSVIDIASQAAQFASHLAAANASTSDHDPGSHTSRRDERLATPESKRRDERLRERPEASERTPREAVSSERPAEARESHTVGSQSNAPESSGKSLEDKPERETEATSDLAGNEPAPDTAEELAVAASAGQITVGDEAADVTAETFLEGDLVVDDDGETQDFTESVTTEDLILENEEAILTEIAPEGESAALDAETNKPVVALDADLLDESAKPSESTTIADEAPTEAELRAESAAAGIAKSETAGNAAGSFAAAQVVNETKASSDTAIADEQSEVTTSEATSKNDAAAGQAERADGPASFGQQLEAAAAQSTGEVLTTPIGGSEGTAAETALDAIERTANSSSEADTVEATPKQATSTSSDTLPSSLERLASGRVGADRTKGQGSEPSVKVDAARFVGRVTKAFQAAQQGDGEVRLRLNPPELGTLQIRISLDDGALVARLEAESSTARTILLDNLPALRERLAEQDIRIEKFDVDVGQEGSQQSSDWEAAEEQRQQHEAIENNRLGVAGTGEEDKPSSSQEDSPNAISGQSEINLVA